MIREIYVQVAWYFYRIKKGGLTPDLEQYERVINAFHSDILTKRDAYNLVHNCDDLTTKLIEYNLIDEQAFQVIQDIVFKIRVKDGVLNIQAQLKDLYENRV